MAIPLASGVWTLVATHSTIAFTVRHMGISKVHGTFEGVEARLTVGDALERSTLTAWVDMSTVDTGNQDRDAHRRSSDFFDVESHPTMSYESLAIRESGAGTYVTEGILTINERSKPLTLTVDFAGTEIYPMDGSTHADFSPPEPCLEQNSESSST